MVKTRPLIGFIFSQSVPISIRSTCLPIEASLRAATAPPYPEPMIAIRVDPSVATAGCAAPATAGAAAAATAVAFKSVLRVMLNDIVPPLEVRVIGESRK
nr:hypothetical protein [Kocuria sp. 257]